MDASTISTLVLTAVSGGAGIMVTAMVAHGTISDLRCKLNGARNDNSRLRRERNQAVEELGFAQAQIEADAKYVDLGKRLAATRAKQNAKARAAAAAKRAGRVA